MSAKNINSQVLGRPVRQSNLELLRIICMILIVLYHCAIPLWTSSESLASQSILNIVGIWGLLGVNCFFLLSAYFLRNLSFKSRKLLKLILQVICYALPFTILYFIDGYFNKGESFTHLFLYHLKQSFTSPLYSQLYWFVTAYIFMYICSPFINLIFKKIGQKNFLKFLLVMTAIPFYGMFDSYALTARDFTLSLYVYMLGIYLFSVKDNWFERNAIKGFIFCTLAIIIFNVIGRIYIHSGINQTLGNTGRYSSVMIIDAIFLFYIFKKLNVRNSVFINTVSSSVFGIYLFHENSTFLLRTICFNKFCVLIPKWKMFIIPFYFSEVVIFFILGSIIDLFRQKFIEKPIMNFIEKESHGTLDKIDKCLNVQETQKE